MTDNTTSGTKRLGDAIYGLFPNADSEESVFVVMGTDEYPGYDEPVAVFESESDAEEFIESGEAESVARYGRQHTDYYTEELPWIPRNGDVGT